MDFHEVAPELRYWLAPHPEWRPGNDWPEEVLSVEYEAPGALVLIDPLVPRGEEDEFWGALDDDVERLGRPVRILLTASWHDRDTALIAQRYDAEIWAHPVGHERLGLPAQGGDLPAGIEAFVPDGNQEGQVAFLIRPERTLVVGDMLEDLGDGLKVFPSPDEPDPAAFVASLHRLLELPIERVLIAHGPPVMTDGLARIREALEST